MGPAPAHHGLTRAPASAVIPMQALTEPSVRCCPGCSLGVLPIRSAQSSGDARLAAGPRPRPRPPLDGAEARAAAIPIRAARLAPAPHQLPAPDTVNPPFPIMYLFGALILCTDMAAHVCVFLEKEKAPQKKNTTQWKRKNSIPLHFWFFAVLACVLLREPGPRLWGPAPQWNPFQVLAAMDGPLGQKGRRVPRAPLEAFHRACQVLLAQGFGPRAGHRP